MIATVKTLDGSRHVWARFYALMEQREFHFSSAENWPTEVKKLHAIVFPGTIASDDSRPHGDASVLIDHTHALILVRVWHGNCYVYVSTENGDIRESVAWVKKLVPEVVPRSGYQTIKFWNLGSQGASSTTRTIEVPTWGSIRPNYTASVQEALDKVMNPEHRPAESGRLILWRGVPGTGKTYAIRSLMQEWSGWASFHYIVDPDKFFGSAPEYMMSVILEDDDEEDGPQSAVRWRVLILEDSGELLAADAKANTGQGLSRLLNLVDGFVGQGLKVLVLVTTNEELGRLHPAVSRAGRCLMNLEFKILTSPEIGVWLKAHGLEHKDPTRSGRLADLYAALNGETPVPVEAIGFVP